MLELHPDKSRLTKATMKDAQPLSRRTGPKDNKSHLEIELRVVVSAGSYVMPKLLFYSFKLV
jgi:hypothetical protein